MSTDTAALQERIEHALWGITQVYDAEDGRGTEVGVHAPAHEVVAAVLPIIAAEVQAAKAEAWDECEATAIIEDAPCSENFLFMVTHAPNPYRTEQTDD